MTSVAATVPTGLSVSGSPITSSGTLVFTWLGVIPNAQVPSPTTLALGGIEAASGATTNSFVTYVDTSGIQHVAQPSFSNISGTPSTTQVPVQSLTTTGSSGAATLSSGVLNIPQYSGYPGAGVPVSSGSAWGTSLTEYGSAVGVATTTDPGTTVNVPMVADGSHGMKPSPSGALGTGAFAATYVLPTATSSVLGGVKPDGTTITNSSGAISCTTAVSPRQLRCVKPDGSTITISGGVIRRQAEVLVQSPVLRRPRPSPVARSRPPEQSLARPARRPQVLRLA